MSESSFIVCGLLVVTLLLSAMANFMANSVRRCFTLELLLEANRCLAGVILHLSITSHVTTCLKVAWEAL